MKYLKLFVLAWMVKNFYTQQGVVDFLNSLPKERAAEAKITCGDTTAWFYVFYRAEKV